MGIYPRSFQYEAFTWGIPDPAASGAIKFNNSPTARDVRRTVTKLAMIKKGTEWEAKATKVRLNRRLVDTRNATDDSADTRAITPV
jgi:hypothetical protein